MRDRAPLPVRVIRLVAAAVLVGVAIGVAARALHVRISGGARWP